MAFFTKGLKICAYFALFIGFLLLNYVMKTSIIEGARTLPRPIINPYYDDNEIQYKPAAPYRGEGLNEIIDRLIYYYFDREGYPFYNTIEIYEKNILSGGPVSDENKRKLTDICYYFINIVIP